LNHASNTLRDENASDWRSFSDLPPLGPAEIHIWHFRLVLPPDEVRRLERLLTPDELERAEGFRDATLRCQYIVGRGIVRELIASYINQRPSDIRFCYGPWGKPELVCDATSHTLKFNLSHSCGYAVLALTLAGKIGVDIERVGYIPEAEWIAQRYFSQAEQTEFFALPPPMRTKAFFTIWSLKEAYLKALGFGWGNPNGVIELNVSPDRSPQLLKTLDSGAEELWSLYKIQADPNFLVAVAISGSNHRIRCFGQLDLDRS
jgi:4'-phosphopantetheinyl transferase